MTARSDAAPMVVPTPGGGSWREARDHNALPSRDPFGRRHRQDVVTASGIRRDAAKWAHRLACQMVPKGIPRVG